jgi:hypothetical protein
MTRCIERHQPRALSNRANAQHSTGPRTLEGKARSAQNALTHGLTSRTTVLPSEDPAAYQHHVQQFQDEYQPQTPTETQLVQELADTAWRLNRIAFLEADLLARAANPQETTFDIVDAHHALASLGLHGQRLSRQFQKTLELLREIQADRQETERRDLTRAAGIMELHKHKGLPYDPNADGFVFSKDQIELHAQRLMRQNDARNIEHVRFFMNPHIHVGGASTGY